MSRRCEVTNKGILTGNNVSHAKNKSRREFGPNLQEISFSSDILGNIRLRVTTSGIRTVEKNGGIDAYLMSKPNRKLTDVTIKLKRRMEKALAKAALKDATSAA